MTWPTTRAGSANAVRELHLAASAPVWTKSGSVRQAETPDRGHSPKRSCLGRFASVRGSAVRVRSSPRKETSLDQVLSSSHPRRVPCEATVVTPENHHDGEGLSCGPRPLNPVIKALASEKRCPRSLSAERVGGRSKSIRAWRNTRPGPDIERRDSKHRSGRVTSTDRNSRFRGLYEATRSQLLAYALRRSASPEDAADVTAETYSVAWRRIEDVPEGDESLLWLYATCRRILANHWRREHRRSELIQRIGVQLQRAVVNPLDVGTDGLLARLALGRLSDEDRELLMLVAWDGLSSTELARMFGCSSTAARIRLHRARNRLVAEMEALEIVTKHTPYPRHSTSREHIEEGPPREA
jgi:RNA polymerase sigma-70 factor (ECF subfamily)